MTSIVGKLVMMTSTTAEAHDVDAFSTEFKVTDVRLGACGHVYTLHVYDACAGELRTWGRPYTVSRDEFFVVEVRGAEAEALRAAGFTVA